MTTEFDGAKKIISVLKYSFSLILLFFILFLFVSCTPEDSSSSSSSESENRPGETAKLQFYNDFSYSITVKVNDHGIKITETISSKSYGGTYTVPTGDYGATYTGGATGIFYFTVHSGYKNVIKIGPSGYKKVNQTVSSNVSLESETKQITNTDENDIINLNTYNDIDQSSQAKDSLTLSFYNIDKYLNSLQPLNALVVCSNKLDSMHGSVPGIIKDNSLVFHFEQAACEHPDNNRGIIIEAPANIDLKNKIIISPIPDNEIIIELPMQVLY